jgi:hypothetical protein
VTIPQAIFLAIVLFFAGVNIAAIFLWIFLWIKERRAEKSTKE